MKNQRIVVIIPARMGSARFPGKPLTKILDLPMVEHVRRRALLWDDVDEVLVAACDLEVRDVVQRSGGKVIMTSPLHERGTDRVEEAARAVEAGIVVNVQGDEPLLMPEAIGAAVQPIIERSDIMCTNLVSPLHVLEDLRDPNIVKAFLDRRSLIMGFARWVKPYSEVDEHYPVYRQTGISAFRKSFLHTYAELPVTPLEQIESVDMWRILEHGYRILGVICPWRTMGVDHIEDVGRIEGELQRDATQRLLYQRIARA